MGNLIQAEASLHRLLSTRPEAHFASTDPALRGWRGRHLLASLLFSSHRHAEAQAQWRQIVRDMPDLFDAWMGLADVAIQLGDAAELEQVAAQVERFQGGAVQAAVLRGRFLLGRGDFAGARALAERLIAQHPKELAPKVILARALRLEGQDRPAEEAWRQVLLLDPCHDEAEAHLSELLRQRMRSEDAYFEARGQLNGWVLGERYHTACHSPSDLQEYLPVLHGLARECKHITDAGTGQGLAALAFLWAQPERLLCLDVVHSPEVERLAALAGQTRFEFRRADTMTADIEETDLLFLDTKHDASQLHEELRRHAGKVRKYLVLHGTTAYATKGESPRDSGIWPVVEEFLSQGSFRLKQRHENSPGLTILQRAGEGGQR
jgi:tetratricopeptide (TPR) repeat protein